MRIPRSSLLAAVAPCSHVVGAGGRSASLAALRGQLTGAALAAVDRAR